MVDKFPVISIGTFLHHCGIGVIDDGHQNIHSNEDDKHDKRQEEDLRQKVILHMPKGVPEVQHAERHGEECLYGAEKRAEIEFRVRE